MNEVKDKKTLEKDLTKIENKILRKTAEIQAIKGQAEWSPYLRDKKISLLKELRNLQYEKIDILNLFDKF